jgi:preprotein translocase subunit SecD
MVNGIAGNELSTDARPTEALMMMEVVDGPIASMEEVKAGYKNGMPEGLLVLPGEESKPDGAYFVLKSEPVISTIDIMEARLEDMRGRPAIGVSLSDAGAVKLGTFTESNIGRRLAIVLFGKVTSAPFIRAKISKNALITGNFTEEEAQKTLEKLKAALNHQN